ncbi:MAG TPA: YraN family protein [Fimbriimonadaceae bacterium]|nr:YraN family protein [Fimbriimonadaceae bacterium]
MLNLRRIGAEAEDRAADYLVDRGYTIVTRRWSTRGGELDLVALDGDVLVFIEVKARSGRRLLPEEAITDQKIQRFLAAVQAYCVETDQLDRPVRYDVVAIDREGVRHYRDAFRA